MFDHRENDSKQMMTVIDHRKLGRNPIGGRAIPCRPVRKYGTTTRTTRTRTDCGFRHHQPEPEADSGESSAEIVPIMGNLTLVRVVRVVRVTIAEPAFQPSKRFFAESGVTSAISVHTIKMADASPQGSGLMLIRGNGPSESDGIARS
jgi:hypothetical protein